MILGLDLFHIYRLSVRLIHLIISWNILYNYMSTLTLLSQIEVTFISIVLYITEIV